MFLPAPHHQHGDHGEEKKIGEGGDDVLARPLPLGRPWLNSLGGWWLSYTAVSADNILNQVYFCDDVLVSPLPLGRPWLMLVAIWGNN